MLGRRERFKGLLQSDRGTAEIEQPRRSPQAPPTAGGAGEVEADGKACGDRSGRQQGGREGAAQ